MHKQLLRCLFTLALLASTPPLWAQTVSVTDPTGSSTATVGLGAALPVWVDILDPSGVRFDQAAFELWTDEGGLVLSGPPPGPAGIWDPTGAYISGGWSSIVAVDAASGGPFPGPAFGVPPPGSPPPTGYTTSHGAWGYVDPGFTFACAPGPAGTCIPPGVPFPTALMDVPFTTLAYTAPGAPVHIIAAPTVASVVGFGGPGTVPTPTMIASLAGGSATDGLPGGAPLVETYVALDVNVDDPPTAHAGPVGGYAFSATTLSVDLDGSASTDPNPFDSLSYEWTPSGGTTISVPGGPYPVAGSPPPTTPLGIVDSGLTSTVDTNTVELNVTDAFGHMDTDTRALLYTNALPSVFSASGTELPDLSMDFEAVFDDADLSINTLIGGFESIEVELSISSLFASGFLTGGPVSPTGGPYSLTGNVSRAALLGLFGTPGTHTVYANIRDLAGETAALGFDITVSAAPEPGTLALLAVSLFGAGFAGRRRIH